MEIILFIWQCLWGCLQSLIGLIFFLIHINDPHKRIGHAIVTKIKGNDSVSLGLFIFINDNSLLMHEYGHTIQSLVLGPFYLLFIGLPSLIWNRLPYFQKKRQRGMSYDAFFIERQATQLGKIYLPPSFINKSSPLC